MKSDNAIPEHMRTEMAAARRWNTNAALGAMLVYGSFVVLLPLLWWLRDAPVTAHTGWIVLEYLRTLTADPFGPLLAFTFGSGKPMTAVTVAGVLIAGLIPPGVISLVLIQTNPHRSTPMLHGDARFARRSDIEAMNDADQVGPSGQYLHFGYAFGQRMALIETLSSIVVAPPGTGKTAKIVVPGIAASDTSCMVVNDPKPELWEICSGHRANLGPCYRLDWSAVDDPAQDLFNPCFNFLDPRYIPPRGSASRDTVIDSLAKTLIPDKKGGETYFTDKGRACLIGFTHYLISAINDSDDPARYDDLGETWRNEAASFAMLVDWFTDNKRAAKAAQAEKGEDAPADPIGAWVDGLVEHAEANGFPRRCIVELDTLVDMADRERSGVVGSMDQGLIPFKNQAVVERTRRSDFVPIDLAGRLSPAALARLDLDEYPRTRADWDAIRDTLRRSDWAPVTVFVCINQAKARAFENLTALFFEVLTTELLSYAAGDVTELGWTVGPFPTGFMLDELVKAAKCDQLIAGPDLGRSKGRYFVIIAQSADQLEERYSKEQRNTLSSSIAVRIVLAQNDKNSIEEIANTVGKTTVKRSSISRQVGLSKQANPWAGSKSEQIEGVNLLNSSNVGRMPKTMHLMVAQGFLNRPVWCRSAFYFSDPELKKKTYNPRLGTGPREAPPLPEFVRKTRRAEHALAVAADNERIEATGREAAFEAFVYRIDPPRLANTPEAGP